MGLLSASARRSERHRECEKVPPVSQTYAYTRQAKPAHYVVIHDDIKMSVEDLEKITHNLSYLYERATKAVSYCPPAFYADRLCERGRCYLMKYVSMRGKPPGTKFDPNAADVPWRSGVNPK